MREATEVVERVDQMAHQVGLRARAGLLTLLHGAAAVIVELGGEPEILVAVLVELALHLVAGDDAARGARVVGVARRRGGRGGLLTVTLRRRRRRGLGGILVSGERDVVRRRLRVARIHASGS